MNRITAFQLNTKLVCALVLLCLFGCVQPWIIAKAGGLSLNAYDLAEWASLAPAQRATTPPLVVPLLLRLQLVIFCALLASIARGRIQKLISALAIGMLAVAQLPPLEFVLDINNLNYSQQFVLAATSLVISCVLMLPVLRRWSTPAVIALATTGIVSSALGLSEAMQLYGEFQLNTAPGAGIWLLSLGYAALIALGLGEISISRSARR